MTWKEYSEIIAATRPRTEYSKVFSKPLRNDIDATMYAAKALIDYANSPDNNLRGDITTGYTYGGKDMNMTANFGLAISEANYTKLHTNKGTTFDVKITNITQEHNGETRFGGVVIASEKKGAGYRTIYKDPYKIKNVIFNDPATIVIWADGTKTVVKTQNGEAFDPEKGLAMAIAKKAFGNQGNYFETFKKWLPEKKEQTPIVDIEGWHVFYKIKETGEFGISKVYKRKCDAVRHANVMNKQYSYATWVIGQEPPTDADFEKAESKKGN